MASATTPGATNRLRVVSFRSPSALVAAVALLAATPAAAGPAASFKGETDQERAVFFKVRSGKVVDFTAGINLLCTGQGIELTAVVPPKALKVSKTGKFAYTGRGKNDSGDIVIKGQLKAKRATAKFTARAR